MLHSNQAVPHERCRITLGKPNPLDRLCSAHIALHSLGKPNPPLHLMLPGLLSRTIHSARMAVIILA